MRQFKVYTCIRKTGIVRSRFVLPGPTAQIQAKLPPGRCCARSEREHFYLPCRCSGGIHRSWHALEMSFLTYRDDGSKALDVPQLAGAYGGAIIAEIPYPSHYSPLVQEAQNGHIQVGANVAINLFREFSPELRRMNPFRHHLVPQLSLLPLGANSSR
jgi:hypothetical protein